MPEHKTQSQTHIVQGFPEGFDEMFMWVSATKEKFSIQKLHENLPESRNQSTYGISVVLPTTKGSQYHLNVGWQVDDKEINLRIEYTKEARHETDKRAPAADQFMEWLGQFFKYESAEAHIHARFEYLLEKRQSAFPLPLKTTLSYDAEIDGIALKLPPKPEGVSRLRLTQGNKLWFVEAIANIRLSFKNFSPYAEVRTISAVVDRILEERTIT